MTSSPLLYVRCGSPPEPVRLEHGEFGVWFARLMDQSGLAVHEHDGTRPLAPPDPRRFAGILISGSQASVAEPAPWMEPLIMLIRSAAELGVPVLGVCFGHQLIGSAFGAHVTPNPSGWEIGTCSVDVTDSGAADPLFAGVPPTFAANQNHHDHIDPNTVAHGNGLVVLARGEQTIVQAIAAGDCVRGVQFHPEFSAQVMTSYLEASRTALGGQAAALLTSTRSCPEAERVFANWLASFVNKA